MITKNSITETKATIAWYKPPMKIRNAMRKLAKAGFSDSGHGAGFGVEDWSMSYNFNSDEYIYVSLSYNKKKKKQTVSISLYKDDILLDNIINSNMNYEPNIGSNKAIEYKNKMLKKVK